MAVLATMAVLAAVLAAMVVVPQLLAMGGAAQQTDPRHRQQLWPVAQPARIRGGWLLAPRCARPTVLVGAREALRETTGGSPGVVGAGRHPAPGAAGAGRDAEAIELLREGISWLPREVELYLQLGVLLEEDTAAAIELYASFPPPPPGEEPSFNHAVLANSAVRLLLGRQDYTRRTSCRTS